MNDLHDLLHDAVDDIDPADRIAELRARTADPARAGRPWWYAAGGVVLATAATVAVMAVVTNDDPHGDPHHEHDHVASDPGRPEQLVPVYFLGPDGSGLVREFDRVPSGDPLQAALDRMQRPPSDPDYFTAWPAGSFGTATLGDGTIDVEIRDTILHPANVQQVVYTVQAAAGERLPVRFLEDGRLVGRFSALPQLDVLYPVNISDPAESTAYVEAASFLARGRASSFEGTVPWELRDDQDRVVEQGFATATGWSDRLHPWETEVDVSELRPGTYTFVAMTSDPSGGAEGDAQRADTRTIILR